MSEQRETRAKFDRGVKGTESLLVLTEEGVLRSETQRRELDARATSLEAMLG